MMTQEANEIRTLDAMQLAGFRALFAAHQQAAQRYEETKSALVAAMESVGLDPARHQIDSRTGKVEER